MASKGAIDAKRAMPLSIVEGPLESVSNLILQLLKIGALVRVSVRRIKFAKLV